VVGNFDTSAPRILLPTLRWTSGRARRADRKLATELLQSLAQKGCEYEVEAYQRRERDISLPALE